MTDYMERHIEKWLLHSNKDWFDGFLQADWWYEDNDEIRPTEEQEAFYRALIKEYLAAEEKSVYGEMFYT